jgi:hypothetical protein
VKLFESCCKYSEEVVIPAIPVPRETKIPRLTRSGMICTAFQVLTLEGREVKKGT